jgi:hypothetical protein
MLVEMDIWNSKLWTSWLIRMIENWKVHLKFYSKIIYSDLAYELEWNNTFFYEKFLKVHSQILPMNFWMP